MVRTSPKEKSSPQPRLIRIRAGGFDFTARMEEKDAPKTCAAFRRMLPLHDKLIHARWSGEACWIPLGDLDVGVGKENATSRPSSGEILLHPADESEAEILFVYGASRFASKTGALEGNHFLTIIAGHDHLPQLGKKVLYEGAQDIFFEEEH